MGLDRRTRRRRRAGAWRRIWRSWFPHRRWGRARGDQYELTALAEQPAGGTDAPLERWQQWRGAGDVPVVVHAHAKAWWFGDEGYGETCDVWRWVLGRGDLASPAPRSSRGRAGRRWPHLWRLQPWRQLDEGRPIVSIVLGRPASCAAAVRWSAGARAGLRAALGDRWVEATAEGGSLALWELSRAVH